MEIALVTETFPPEVNGVARSLSHLVEGLARRGHRLAVVRPRQGRQDRPREEGGVTQLPLPGAPLPRYDGLRFGLPARRRLERRWARTRPTVVHVATEGPLGWSALRAATGLGLPVSSSFHTNFHLYGRHYGYGALQRVAVVYLRAFHNRAACTLVPSESARATLAERGFRNLGILARGVDSRLFAPDRRREELRRSWGAGPGDPVVAYVGRLAGEKNLPLAVRAFLAARERVPGARFVLVGDGPSRQVLERRHPELLFCGMRRGEDLAAHYASADLLLFPSLTETFGNVVTEAMASGLAVVAFDYAAAGLHLEHGANGLALPLGDEEAFVAAACALAAEPERARRLGRAARRTAEGITWEAVVTSFEARLERLAAGAPTPGEPSPGRRPG